MDLSVRDSSMRFDWSVLRVNVLDGWRLVPPDSHIGIPIVSHNL